MKMESMVQREDPSVDVVTLETPNLTSLIGTNSATLPRKFLFWKYKRVIIMLSRGMSCMFSVSRGQFFHCADFNVSFLISKSGYAVIKYPLLIILCVGNIIFILYKFLYKWIYRLI